MSDILSEDKLSTSKSYDSIRKLIILLDFYRFWVNAKLNSETEYYKTLDEDKLTEIYIEEANNCLYDCGYEDLYAGNPYDWIFLCSARKMIRLIFLDPVFLNFYWKNSIYNEVSSYGKISIIKFYRKFLIRASI